MIKKKIILTYLIISILFIISCKVNNLKNGIDLTFSITPLISPFNKKTDDSLILTENLFIKMNFKYKTNDKFIKFDNNYKIFVHFWQKKNNKMLINLDHSLESIGVKKTSKWQKGDIIQYSMKTHIPKYINDYDTKYNGYDLIYLTVGFYDPETQKKTTLLKRNIHIEIEENHAPEIIYKSGWHKVETKSKAKINFKKWRWTKKKAICVIENKNFKINKTKYFNLIVRGVVKKHLFDDQFVTFKINGNILEKFIPTEDVFYRKYILSAAKIGDESTFILSIETNRTFIPSKLVPENKDFRELGVQIFNIYLRESAD